MPLSRYGPRSRHGTGGNPAEVCPVRPRGRRFRWIVALALGAAAAVWPSLALANPPRPNWNPGPPPAPLFPRTSEMHQISDLFWVMLILSGIIFIGVCAAIVISMVRFSGKPGDPEPRQVFGNRRVELLWTAIPSVILVVAFVFTVRAIRDINSAHGSSFNIYAIGHQWWWEFQYPSLKIVTANELHVPTGQQIHFHVESWDVIHSFWAPQLQRQIDANPKQDNAVYAEYNIPGVYGGACYEYCGPAHAWMKFEVVVQTPAQFAAWVKHEQKPAATPHGATAAGLKVFLNNTCVNCHAILGTGAGGAVGPNLTHFSSRWTIGAGAAPMTRQALVQWIRDPSSFKPGALMPPYKFLSNKDVNALADYLMSLK
ncbi:MAG TPA: cytochrome c oxidase subunit II [Chloroflexota bacterium]|nr:cytochrome c oxidase subunit II [Chloroflexota bacterium]